jgi:hypothetical protein
LAKLKGHPAAAAAAPADGEASLLAGETAVTHEEEKKRWGVFRATNEPLPAMDAAPLLRPPPPPLPPLLLLLLLLVARTAETEAAAAAPTSSSSSLASAAVIVAISRKRWATERRS